MYHIRITLIILIQVNLRIIRDVDYLEPIFLREFEHIILDFISVASDGSLVDKALPNVPRVKPRHISLDFLKKSKCVSIRDITSFSLKENIERKPTH